VTKATSRKSKTCQWQKRWKKDRYQFVILWWWYWRCFDNPDIFTWHKNDFVSFKILVSKFVWWKGRHFYDRPLGVLCLATPLHLTEKIISLNPARPWNHKPEPGVIPTLVSEARFRPTKQIYRMSQDMRNCGVLVAYCNVNVT